ARRGPPSGPPRLEVEDLREPAHVAFGAREARARELAGQRDGQVDPDDARAQAQHVGVVILARLPRREEVVAEGRADAPELVGRDRDARAAAADEHAEVRAPLA